MNALHAQPVAPVMTQVQGETARLHEAIEYMTKAIDNLSNRLIPVVRSAPPEAKTDGQVVEVVVSVAEGIRNARLQVQNLIANIDSLVNRLEV